LHRILQILITAPCNTDHSWSSIDSAASLLMRQETLLLQSICNSLFCCSCFSYFYLTSSVYILHREATNTSGLRGESWVSTKLGEIVKLLCINCTRSFAKKTHSD